MQFNKSTFAAFRQDVEAALQGVAGKYGIQITAGSISYDQTAFTCRLEAARLGDDGVAQTQEREDFKRFAETFGLKPGWLDRSFSAMGDTWTIIGLKFRSKKYPVLCSRTGKKGPEVRKLSAETVRRYLQHDGVQIT